jgi:hypothetical protein
MPLYPRFFSLFGLADKAPGLLFRQIFYYGMVVPKFEARGFDHSPFSYKISGKKRYKNLFRGLFWLLFALAWAVALVLYCKYLFIDLVR